MKLTLLCLATRMGSVTENLALISQRVQNTYENAPKDTRAPTAPRLVAVSKTKPIELIVEAYKAGQRHFGENYIQELCEKSRSETILGECPDIKWHFIGNCQSNKAKDLMKCPNLTLVETVISEKLADKLNSQGAGKNVSVMVQINTSGEANKNGLEPDAGVACAEHIVGKCPNLKLVGLMTIGDLGNSMAAHHQGSNPDFIKLKDVRRKVAEALKWPETDLELSMGMSNDFEEAIRLGSCNVRVGSSIFGARNYPKTADPAAAGDRTTQLENDLHSVQL